LDRGLPRLLGRPTVRSCGLDGALRGCRAAGKGHARGKDQWLMKVGE
jgi:hypothetical protein